MIVRSVIALMVLFFVTVVHSQQTQISFSPGSNNQTFTTCNGFIIDSGGQGGSGYSNNEDVVITVCPDNPGISSVLFLIYSTSALPMTIPLQTSPMLITWMYTTERQQHPLIWEPIRAPSFRV